MKITRLAFSFLLGLPSVSPAAMRTTYDKLTLDPSNIQLAYAGETDMPIVPSYHSEGSSSLCLSRGKNGARANGWLAAPS